MTAKKKAPKMTRAQRAARGANAAMVIDRWAGMELELGRHITTIRELRKQLAAEKTSTEFWTYEASRWRTEAEDLRRQEAIERVERGVN